MRQQKLELSSYKVMLSAVFEKIQCVINVVFKQVAKIVMLMVLLSVLSYYPFINQLWLCYAYCDVM